MQSLDRAYRHCRKIAKARARNFFYAFTVLPRAQRDAICAVYAFMRKADDLADAPGLARGARLDGMRQWRRGLEAHLAGARRHAVLTALADTATRHEIPHEYFFDLLDGMESDLDHQTFANFEDLYRYCYRAASVVGLTTAHVFGVERKSALDLAERCGVAFQLTNILRDIPVDAAMGRVYLPRDELRSFGIRPRELLEGTVSSDDGRFQGLMQFQWDRAESYYRESAPLVALTSPACRPALWAMIATYRGILHRVRRSRFDVFSARASLPTRSKLAIVLRAMLYRATGGMPSLPA